MEISATTEAARTTEADTIAIGVFEGEELGEQAPPELSGLLASGEARSSFKALALAHAGGKRWLPVGLGKRESFSAQRPRIAAAAGGGPGAPPPAREPRRAGAPQPRRGPRAARVPGA